MIRANVNLWSSRQLILILLLGVSSLLHSAPLTASPYDIWFFTAEEVEGSYSSFTTKK
jgi:hypothetical protein